MSEHVHYDCKCNAPYCQFCDGGLFACTVCGGFEGTLTTYCPGEKVDDERLNEVYAGRLDYRDGRGWVKPDGTGTSMGDTDVKIGAQR